MFKNFNGIHLVDAYHKMRQEKKSRPSRVAKKIIEAIIVAIVTLIVWNLPQSCFGIDGLTVV